MTSSKTYDNPVNNEYLNAEIEQRGLDSNDNGNANTISFTQNFENDRVIIFRKTASDKL